MKYKSLPLIAFAFISCAFAQSPGDDQHKLPKTLTEENNYTNVGNIGLAITNFGEFGNGFANLGQAKYTPSCEYPKGSGIEHIFAGGLWVGGFMKDGPNSNTKFGPFVTTGAVDRASLSRGGGFEFTTDKTSHIVQRSSKEESTFYNPLAISHQDFLADYNDTNLTSQDGSYITDHNPLGISVHQESYAWDFPFADAFVIMNFTIKNISKKYLDSVYVGLYSDAVVRNTKITTVTNSDFFSHSGLGYDDSLKLSYCFDSNGDVGFTDSYVGFLMLGSTPIIDSLFFQPNTQGETDTIPSTCYVAWQWNSTSGSTDLYAPQTDIQRYIKMQGYFQYPLRYKDGFASRLHTPSNRSEMITHGYFHNIAPDSSINVVYAILCGKKFGNDPAELDTRAQRNNLYNNADWAIRAYWGNDKNRNGILDPGEDLFGDGLLHRYVLPAPPAGPIVKVIPENNKATIYWDKRSEKSVDPISNKKDFAGYKIYRTQSGFDLTNYQNIQASLVTLAQYDSAGVTGFNNGFAAVELSQPVTFPNDTTHYYYKYEMSNLLNGWQYLFTVTAFDKGDPINQVDPLESSQLASLKRIIPGTLPSNDDNLQPGVYPNPYYGNAIWDGASERLRKIYFNNLPSDCEITIYTLAGDVVKRMQHSQNSNGSNIRWFEQYAGDNKQQFSGGEHAWDLVTDNDQAVATGLYLFTVKNNTTGKIKTGKFLVIK
jgi:hypothetical protein